MKFSKNSLILSLILGLTLIRFGLGLRYSAASDLTPNNIAQAVNNERTSRNIPALNYNDKLAAAAQFKAQDMINRNYFAHVDSDGNYIWPKIAEEGYTPYTILGENLAINFPDTESLMSAWMDSPTHRENILNTSFKDQGIGVAFGNAASGQYAQSIANTFGAQPTAPSAPAPTPAPVKQAPPPTPAKTSSPAPTKTTAKKTAPAQQAPAAQQSTAPAPASAPAAPAQTAPQTPSAPANPPPVFDLSATTITAKLENQQIDFQVSTNIVGQVSSAIASLDGQSVPMLAQANNIYTADLLVSKDYNYTSQQVIISAANQSGSSNSAKLFLNNIPVQGLNSGSNPIQKLAGAATQQAHQPDLYNIFKYIVYFFGLLFIILMLTDALTASRKKMDSLLDIGNGTNILLILLLFGSMFFVNWWH